MSADPAAVPIVVQGAPRHDIPQLLDLLEQVAAEGRWVGTEAPVDRTAREQQMSEGIDGGERAARFLTDAGGSVVGHLWMDLRPYGVAELGMLVARDWRNQGVGSALMDAGLQWARRAGGHKVALQLWPLNHAAMALYRKFGFVQEGLLRRHYPRRNGELWDAVVMGLVLDEDRPGSRLS